MPTIAWTAVLFLRIQSNMPVQISVSVRIDPFAGSAILCLVHDTGLVAILAHRGVGLAAAGNDRLVPQLVGLALIGLALFIGIVPRGVGLIMPVLGHGDILRQM